MQMKENIPYYISRYIDYCKEHKLTILGAFDPIGDFGEDLLTTYKGDVQKCLRWVKNNSNVFASAWVNGYWEIEPSKYIVRVKCTKEELIEAGFDWVFFGDGVTVEEVYDE